MAGLRVESLAKRFDVSARKLFVASGLADDEAKKRSFLLYAYIFGQSLMACDRYDPNISAIKRRIAKHIVNNPIDSRSTPQQ